MSLLTSLLPGNGTSAVVDVLDYVVGEPASVTDWAVPIRAALAAASDGDIVQLPAVNPMPLVTTETAVDGVRSAFAVVPSGVRVLGRGVGATKLQIDASVASSTIYVFDLSDRDGCEVAYLTIDGNRDNRTGQGDEALIELGTNPGDTTDRAKRNHLHDLHLLNSKAEAIDSDGSHNLFIDSIVAENCDGLGVHCRGNGNGNVVVVNSIFQNLAHVRLAGGGANAESAAAIDYQGDGRFVCANNIIDRCARGVILHQANNAQVVNNSILAFDDAANTNYTAGIWVRGASSGVSETILGNNNIRGGITPILIEAGRDVSILGGLIALFGGTAPSTDGIKASAFTGLHIKGVVIKRLGGATQDAIDISAPTGTTRRVTVSGVTVEDIYNGLRINGTLVSVQGCEINALQDGVRIEAGSSVLVQGNRINGTRAVFMTGSPTNCRTIGNELVGSSSAYTASGSGHIKQANVENGAWVA